MRFLVVCPASLEASAAIDGPVVLGNERNLGGSAALCADRIIHLTIVRALALAGVPARFATDRLILEAFLGIEFLFACGEREFLAAVTAHQILVLVHEWYPPEL